jgi:hypothetical protein
VLHSLEFVELGHAADPNLGFRYSRPEKRKEIESCFMEQLGSYTGDRKSTRAVPLPATEPKQNKTKKQQHQKRQ